MTTPSAASSLDFSKIFNGSRSSDERILIEWKNLRFSTIEKDKINSKLFHPQFYEKHILKGLNGEVASGELLAILGPTGCGKTSLLNILAARVPSGGANMHNLSGTILVNGKPRNDSLFRSISAYVVQDDFLYPHLTVHETLTLAANFFLPSSTTEADKNNLVDSVISNLSLVKARDTRIGDEKVRGISGGERKRTCIAVQLISDPAVLFLDEPTSGLDAFQAQSVMESMKSLVSMGRLVITVIHQPRSSIYNMFDKLLVLSEGRTMYFGHAPKAVEYFGSKGHLCPDVFNPSDYFLDILSPDSRSPESESAARNRINYLGDAWEVNTTAIQSSHQNYAYSNIDEIKSIGGESSIKKTFGNFELLCWRAWSEQSRDVFTICLKLFFTCFFALLLGGIYSHLGYGQRSIQNRIGLLFFIAINQGFNGITGVLNSFPKEKMIVNTERSGNAYGTMSYFIAKVVVEIPLNVLPSLVFSCIVYWMAELNPDRFGLFILILMLETMTAIALGLAVSALMPTIEAANAVGPPLMIIGILFGGFYININSLPIVANWIPYLSLLRWAFQALAINEFRGETFTCGSLQSACVRTGEQVLANLSFDGRSTSYAVFGLSMLLIGFLASAYTILDNSRMKYIGLGHSGAKYKNYHSNNNNNSKNNNSNNNSNNKSVGEYELVKVSDDLASSSEPNNNAVAV